jgi:hypothetical protein
MRKLFTTFLTLVSVLWLSHASAQTIDPHHNHTLSPQIDGALHPEQIPDASAYRLFLGTAGTHANATEQEKAKRLGIIERIGMSAEDTAKLVQIADTYRQTFDVMIQQYNAGVEALAKAHRDPDQKAFIVQREALVESTRQSLQQLSPSGRAKLHEFIQQEKHSMAVSVPQT